MAVQVLSRTSMSACNVSSIHLSIRQPAMWTWRWCRLASRAPLAMEGLLSLKRATRRDTGRECQLVLQVLTRWGLREPILRGLQESIRGRPGVIPLRERPGRTRSKALPDTEHQEPIRKGSLVRPIRSSRMERHNRATHVCFCTSLIVSQVLYE